MQESRAISSCTTVKNTFLHVTDPTFTSDVRRTSSAPATSGSLVQSASGALEDAVVVLVAESALPHHLPVAAPDVGAASVALAPSQLQAVSDHSSVAASMPRSPPPDGRAAKRRRESSPSRGRGSDSMSCSRSMPRHARRRGGAMPDASEEEWERRLSKRRDIVEHVKASPGYATYFAARERGIANPRAPATPDACDRRVSKRQWESEVMAWRNALKAWGDVGGSL